jgi:hypothetical protein
MNTGQGKGKTTGLHKPYFNGSPAQKKSEHPIPTPPKPSIPGQRAPSTPYAPKGC